jgi:alpha-1,6-mannosyltransferase
MLVCQFHLPFYASRMLPNMFAMIFINLAIAFWIDQREMASLFFLTFTTAVFRCDMIILAIPIILHMLIINRITLQSILKVGVLSSLFSAGITVLVDSFFWNQKRLVWPEYEVLFFNTVLNKSSDWGISPFHWYFTNALPKAFLCFLPFLLISLFSNIPRKLAIPNINYESLKLIFPFISFIGLYSLLPHKELRFILPVVPVLTYFAASGFIKVELFFEKTLPKLKFLLYGAFIINALISSGFFYLSYNNYPGGYALLHLQSNINNKKEGLIQIHVCDLAATTGVSRFLEIPGIHYNKTDLYPSCCDFDFVISEDAEVNGFSHIYSQYAFDRISKSYPFVKFSPRLHILKKSSAHCKCKITFS